jgi:uncharacterized protein YbbC (DUF1343 family)
MMRIHIFKNTVLLFVLITISCASKADDKKQESADLMLDAKVKTEVPYKENDKDTLLVVGANQVDRYLPILKGKKIGIVANQTSVIFKNSEQSNFTHIVDSLLSLNVLLKKVFTPEHGFRGKADAGEVVKDGFDLKSGLPIVSLYGKNKKPSEEQLAGLDILVFDIQDVGARFYTYISSLHYIMEACAEQNIPMLILDRPNPNGHYIDGPILESTYNGFVGMHPIPIVHGLTIGEYAQMINGEGWLENSIVCELQIIPVLNYTHETTYSLPIKPSPNLPNDVAINLYPSLCLFEGTNVSIGRGTEMQFQIAGSPYHKLKPYNFEFTPQPNEGAKYPKHENLVCYGYDLRNEQKLSAINLKWLIDFYRAHKNHSKETSFFTPFFTKLAGTKQLQKQIENGFSEEQIKETWENGLKSFDEMRVKYMLYK